MHSPRSHAELATLRKAAQEMAASRKERMTTIHLLAAIAAVDGPGGALLRDRKLDTEALLKATRAFDEEGPDPLNRLHNAARDVASRGPAKEPSALHLLLALLADRNLAAHRALVQAGVDVARLRTSAMQIALGVVSARRMPSGERRARLEGDPKPASVRPPSLSLSPGVAVPLFPVRPQKPLRPETREESRRSAPPPGVAPAPPVEEVSPAPASVELLRPAPLPGLPANRFPVLSAVGRDLTALALEDRLDPVVGRDEEVDQLLDVLAKRTANSACLVGPAGVGKTSVVRALARRFAETRDPRRLIELSVSDLLAGTATRGALAERLLALVTEIQKSDRGIVLFVDELCDLFGSGALDEAMAEIKRALAKGELLMVGEASVEEYRKTIEADGGLARRFTPIEIEEPSAEDAFLVLRETATSLGRHHTLAYSDEALASTVSWSIRYLPGRALPDKAISILDLAGARARRLADAAGRGPGKAVSVGPAEVASVVAELADLPVERLLETDRQRMLALEKLLAERVVGHAPALERIARVLRRNAAGLRERRPIGSFLLLGPTGVGKTETAKAIAEALFHSENAMTRLDFSEYAEAHAVARLIGAPPGYIGHESGGQLTESVRRRPYQLVLLDEIEKAHRDVLEAFLQVFDEGRLTDGRGRRVDFTNTVIVMTSNLGASEIAALRTESRVGFTQPKPTASRDRFGDTMIAAARAHLPPELYNRIDEVLCYAPLTRDEVAEIARRLLEDLGASLERRGVRLDVESDVVEALLAAGGFDVTLGARPMKRVISRLVENPLADLILRGDLESGSVAMVSVERGEIAVDSLRATAARPRKLGA